MLFTAALNGQVINMLRKATPERSDTAATEHQPRAAEAASSCQSSLAMGLEKLAAYSACVPSTRVYLGFSA